MVLHATPSIGRGLMTRARIDLFFDCVSPYTHFSLSSWTRYADAWPVTLKPRPFFLGGVMKATGNKPPAVLAPKAKFMAEDLRRSANLYDVPYLDLPDNFFSPELQKSAMGVARLLCAAELAQVGDAKLLELAVSASMCMHADQAFRNGGELTIDDRLLHAACSRANLDGSSLVVDATSSDSVKEALRANTEEGVARGAFGSPTAFVFSPAAAHGAESEAIFFGSDRMEQLAHHLSLPYLGPAPTRE